MTCKVSHCSGAAVTLGSCSSGCNEYCVGRSAKSMKNLSVLGTAQRSRDSRNCIRTVSAGHHICHHPRTSGWCLPVRTVQHGGDRRSCSVFFEELFHRPRVANSRLYTVFPKGCGEVFRKFTWLSPFVPQAVLTKLLPVGCGMDDRNGGWRSTACAGLRLLGVGRRVIHLSVSINRLVFARSSMPAQPLTGTCVNSSSVPPSYKGDPSVCYF